MIQDKYVQFLYFTTKVIVLDDQVIFQGRNAPIYRKRGKKHVKRRLIITKIDKITRNLQLFHKYYNFLV